MSRVEPTKSSEVKRYGDPRRSQEDRSARKPSQAEGEQRTVDEALENQEQRHEERE
jgi:hypothetical protein